MRQLHNHLLPLPLSGVRGQEDTRLNRYFSGDFLYYMSKKVLYQVPFGGILLINNKYREEYIMDITKFKWTREPEQYHISSTQVEIITSPYTDLWQKTYYHFK